MTNPRSTRVRLALTIIAVFAVVIVFAVRLVDIQVVRASELSTAAVKNRSVPQTIYGSRGEITDTNGVVLADSVDRFDVTVSPKDVGPFNRVAADGSRTTVSVDAALGEIGKLTGQSVADLQKALVDKNSNFAYLSKTVKLAVVQAVIALKIPWVYDELRPSRTYPNGAVAGNLIGFIGTDGPQAGIELSENKCLASKNGTSTYERGADGVRMPGSTVTETPAKDGGTIKLTIDRDLQWFSQETLASAVKAVGAQWGTAVVVRTADAHIMAMADYPTVDPNNVSGAKRSALGSLAFSTPYEPGSTFKPMTVASLIDAGKIGIGTKLVVPSVYNVDGGEISDSWSHETMHYTVAGVIEMSSNIGISVMVNKLDKYKRHDYMVKFGIGSKTDVGFQYESAGSLKPAKDWDPITDKTVQFGQGVSVTTAQMASIYQTLGNGGVKKPLTLVEGCTAADGTVTEKPSTKGTRVVSEYAADQTLRAMETVVTDGWLSPQITIPGYRVAAKTGTAEVATNGSYTGDRIVSVAGIAPADNPEYAVIVTIGLPTTMKTSGAAAPAFQKIMAQVLKKYRAVPSKKAASPIPLTW